MEGIDEAVSGEEWAAGGRMRPPHQHPTVSARRRAPLTQPSACALGVSTHPSANSGICGVGTSGKRCRKRAVISYTYCICEGI